MFDAYLGTHDGVYRLSGSQVHPVGLDGQRISAIHAWRDPQAGVVILAGSYGDGMFRSGDGGCTFSPVGDGLTAPAFRTICPDPVQAGAILCGTEPGRTFRSEDGGRSWRELDGIRRLAGYEEWYLPYSPRAGAVRNIYSPHGNGSRLMASVEVGGLIESRDGGATWSYVDVGPDHDIHHITGHPTDGNLLYASLGYAALKSQRREGLPKLGGIARSRDGGVTWQKIQTDYTRATIVPPTRPDLLLAGPAPEVSHLGRIEVSSDGGDNWQPAGTGIDIPMEDMVELFQAAPDGSIWAICSGGRLLRAEAGEWHWRSAAPVTGEPRVEAVAFVGVV